MCTCLRTGEFLFFFLSFQLTYIYYHSASQEGHLPVLRVLLNAGADVNFVNRKTRYCDSPITIAAYFGQIKAVALLLGAGADASHVTADDRTCESMLKDRHNAKLPEPSVEGIGWSPFRHHLFSSNHKKILMLMLRMCTLSSDKMIISYQDEVSLAYRIPWVIWLETFYYTSGGWFSPKRTSAVTKKLLQKADN